MSNIKTIIFDFDGTLTTRGENLWKIIFEYLGCETQSYSCEYKTQIRDFLSGKTTYQQWCDETCISYRSRGFAKQMLFELANKISLVADFEKVTKFLFDKGIKLNVVSGNFVEVIEYVLGDNAKYFESINANKIVFDKDGIIQQIVGTNYDFEGKKRFVEEYCLKNNILPKQVYFVGNGDNDEWASLSGCKTLCVNPEGTDAEDKTKWSRVIYDMKSLKEILPIILGGEEI